jgi:hypothetical protein
VTALGALARAVSRVDGPNLDALALGLVADEVLKLAKCPPRVSGPIRSPHRRPRTDASKVFEGDPAIRVLGATNEPFGNLVVDVTTKAGFARAKPYKMAFGALGACLLKPAPKREHSRSLPLDVLARRDIAVGVDGEVDDTQVEAEIALGRARLGLGKVEREDERGVCGRDDEVGLPAGVGEALAMVVACPKPNMFAAAEREDADVLAPAREDARVVGDRAQASERRTLGEVASVSTRDLGDGANRHLRRETKTLTHVPVDEPLELELGGEAMLEGDLCDELISNPGGSVLMRPSATSGSW